MVTFFTNNSKGFQPLNKRFKFIEYLRDKSNPNGFLLLKKTRSIINDKTLLKWNLHNNLGFIHGSYNSSGVLNVYFGCKFFQSKKYRWEEWMN